ncbi:hypothetical protein GALAXY_61 [Arthrobacter phage Galaxy]|uniref:Uncharacterized protein n=1 Tax=Arthrobacter phage Galaxy TaxID=1772326 RepID=A0A0U3TIW3_9CAUD|nr:hypothetical protein FDG93_gp61 [Arthrobacter phage Galaxy]ALY08905.1 hypothetical protein GALAXY_61 [Arthrobacter phage Galaxy]
MITEAELVGKCRLCGYRVELRGGVWVHDGGISARMAHAVAVGVARINAAVAASQEDFALAGPSKGGGA